MNYTSPSLFSFFFFNDTATTEIYTLSLHDALPISCIGLYGLLSYEVGRRTRELGIRVALGAHHRDLSRLEIGRAHAELQSPCNLVCRLLLEKKKHDLHPQCPLAIMTYVDCLRRLPC